MKSDDIKKEIEILRNKEKILLNKYEEAKRKEIEDNLKKQYINDLAKKQQAKHNIEEAKIVGLDCYYDTNPFFSSYTRDTQFDGIWSGSVALYDDGWFEGCCWDIIDRESVFDEKKDIKWSEGKFIFGIYDEDKYIELIKLSKNGMSDPFVFRGITTNDIDKKNKYFLREYVSEFKFAGPLRTIGLKEKSFGACWLKMRDDKNAKEELFDNLDNIKKEKTDNMLNCLYKRMLAYKEDINEELLKMYTSGEMYKIYIKSFKINRCYESPDDCYAINGVLEEGYGIDEETAEKVVEYQYRKRLER